MKALILNSGLGQRMGVITNEHPKCMTEVSYKNTILSRQLRILTSFGVDEVIMTTGYYLSFPSYYRKDGKVYIFPEQGARGATWLYEYDEDTCVAKELRVINPNDTVDTTILELVDGTKVLTCTTAPDYNGSVLDIYPFHENDCPTTLKPIMQIESPHKTARNAGAFFKVGDTLYRPAQYCEHYYGEGTEIQKVVFDGDILSFQPIRILFSPSEDYPDALHTFNVFENKWVVVDGRRKRFPLLAKMLGK